VTQYEKEHSHPYPYSNPPVVIPWRRVTKTDEECYGTSSRNLELAIAASVDTAHFPKWQLCETSEIVIDVTAKGPSKIEHVGYPLGIVKIEKSVVRHLSPLWKVSNVQR
jgi:hypothetical protein